MKNLVAIAFMLIGAPPQAQPEAKIPDIEVRFFKPDTSAFTDNVLDETGSFSGWNTFMLEGNGGYGRGDALVVVRLSQALDGEAEGTLTISATRNGKLLQKRRFTRIDFREGRSVSRTLYLQDIGCSGETTIRADFKGRSQKARLILGCGE